MTVSERQCSLRIILSDETDNLCQIADCSACPKTTYHPLGADHRTDLVILLPR
jgi:hypothetical protein